jgi:hypothetical protein
MMRDHEPVLVAAEALRCMLPPAAVIHVGAGAGTGPAHQWRSWDVEKAWLLDAQETRLSWTMSALEQHGGWHVIPKLIGADEASAPFHLLTNPAESGMLAAEVLASIWPGLRALGVDDRPVHTLDSLLASDIIASDINWLVIDCWPTRAILTGAHALLGKIDVVWARIALGESTGPFEDMAAAHIAADLALHGFRQVHISEAHHPMVGVALYARPVPRQIQRDLADRTRELERCSNEVGRHAARLEELGAELQQLTPLREQLKVATEQCEQQARLAADLQRKLDLAATQQFTLERSLEVARRDEQASQGQTDVLKGALAAKVDELRDVQEQLTRANDAVAEQKKLVGDGRSQLDEVRTQLAKTDRLATERATQVAALEEQLAALTTQHAELARDNAARAQEFQEREAGLSKYLSELNRAKAALALEFQSASTQLTEQGSDLERLRSEVASLRDQLQERDNELQAFTQLREQYAALGHDRDEQARAAAERQAELEKLSGTLRSIKERTDALERDQTVLTEAVELARAAKLSDEEALRSSEAENGALKQSLHAVQTRLAETIAAAELIAQERDDAHARLTEADSQRDDLGQRVASLTSELQAKAADLEACMAQAAQTRRHQRLFEDEMLKAEAQIELIRDVLLKDGGL